MATGFAYSVLMRTRPIPADRRLTFCRAMVDTVNSNIAEFLAGRERVVDVSLENMADDCGLFWARIGAEGDRGAAMRELTIRHNARTS